jgi:hypothetical protein
MHDQLAAAYVLNGAYYNMSLTEIMNAPMPIRLEGAVPRGTITQFLSRDLSGNILNPPMHTIRILHDQPLVQPRHYVEHLSQIRHTTRCPICEREHQQRAEEHHHS